MKSNGNFRVCVNYKPVILFDRLALKQAQRLVQKVSTECQWFHRVRREVQGNQILYHVFDIYIPEQEVSMANVESGPEVFMKLSSEVKAKCGGYNDQFNETIRTLNCWIHSHVNMACTPSGTDNEQFQNQIQQASSSENAGAQIMMIFNKKNEYFSRVYDRELGLMFEYVPLAEIDQGIDFTYVDEAIKDKLKRKVYNYARNHHHSNGWRVEQTKGGPGGNQAWLPKQGKHKSGGSQHLRDKMSGPKPDSKKTLAQLAKESLMGTSPETPTEELSIDNIPDMYNFPEAHVEAIKEYLEEINNSNSSQDALDKLTALVDGYLYSKKELQILTHLLFKDIDDCLEEVTMWTYVDQEDCYEEAIHEFQEFVKNSTIDIPTFFEAHRVAMFINELESEDDKEAVLGLWFGSMLEEVVEAENKEE